MSYTVLARKYRSQAFDDVIGQEAISQTLKNAIKKDRVAHAYLFTGTRGVGKTTMARILAKSLNCHKSDGPTAEPCCKCESCVNINTGEDMDVIEIDGASNNSVDDIRELRENAIYTPARSRFKIYIIDEVHMLSNSAFNALLKTLEEPPEHVKFIFATTEPNKVISTIQSRCQRFDFNNISPTDIAEQLKTILKKEKIKFKNDIILPLAKMANGSMRDGLSLLDRLISTGTEPLSLELLEEFLGCPNKEKIFALTAAIADSDAPATLETIEDLITTGLSEPLIVDAMVEMMRDLMIAKSAGTDSELLILNKDQKKQLAELAEKFDIAAIVYNITTLEKLRWAVKNSDTPRALLEAAFVRLTLSEHFINVDSLLDNLQDSPQTALKKKNIKNSSKSSTVDRQPVSEGQSESFTAENIGSLKGQWKQILKTITEKLGKGTAGILSMAEPRQLQNDVLTLSFPDSAAHSMHMCQSNGRKEQIEEALGDILGNPVKLKLARSSGEKTKAQIKKEKSASEKRNELLNDPAVRTVLMELDATVTSIEEIEK